MSNGRKVSTVTGLALAVLAGAAQMSFAGGLQRTIFRNFNDALTPSSISQPQGGPLFNYDNFSQRLEYDRVGDGYAYEFYRFFGPDSFGEPNTLNLGGFTLELGPDPQRGQTQYTGVHGRAGFTTRLIPEVYFTGETGQRAFNQFSGISTFNNEPIAYSAKIDTGIQNFDLDGNLQFNSSGKINVLGFYDFQMRVINVGSLTADGVVLKDEQVTDFDTGEINVSGQIVLDALASLLQANGNALSAAPPTIFSAAAQKERTADELMTALQSGEELTDEELQFMMEQMFVQAFLKDPIGFIMNGPPTTIPGFEGLQLETVQSTSPRGTIQRSGIEEVPEPGTVVLIALTSGAAILIRKRRGLK